MTSRACLLRSVFAMGLWLACASNAAAQGSSCTISVTSLAFGNYNVFTASPADSTATITYQCNAAATNISIALSPGASSSHSLRTLKKGNESLNYNLYQNAARTNIWGDGTAGTTVYTRNNPPNNGAVNVTIYGRIPAGQDVSAGAYADTISATINF